MTVYELIEVLKYLPEDAEVRVYPPEGYRYEYVSKSDVFTIQLKT